MIIKVVYFDEGSATDYIYICEGGKVDEKKDHIVSKSTALAAKAEAKAEAKFKFFSFLSASANADTRAEVAREGNTIISKAISNTILTDYLSLVDTQDKQNRHIIEFKDCLLYPYPESFAFYKMLTPYMIMTEGKVDIGSDMKLNVAMMDKALESGRGYYELIADQSGIKSVLRFNIKAFRNNYSISDLVKMRLCYHAIEVGIIPESSLAMQSEFSQFNKEINGYQIMGEEKQDDGIKVYDVIFAGVNK
ncbi:MAG: DUF6414 family protein [Clostridiales bacterium]|nr:DUF6414 family protein [Clostridiales bacterium]